MFHPLDLITLCGFTFGFLVCLFLIGDTFIRLFKSGEISFGNLDVFERINMKLIIGSIILIILVLLLTVFGFLLKENEGGGSAKFRNPGHLATWGCGS